VRLGLAKALDRRVGGALGRLVGWADRASEALRPPGPVPSVRRVLVVKFWGLGNWALLRPILADLRARWSGARFAVLTLAANAPLARDLADDLLLVRPERFGTVVRDLAAAVRRLRRESPDLALDFEQFARSGALVARAAGAAQRVGFRTGDPGRDGLYTALVPFRSDAHASRSFRDLAEAAGLAAGPYRPGRLVPAPEALHAARALAGEVPYVVLHPGSGDNFPGRRWSAAGFAAAGRVAVEAGHRVLVTGSAAEASCAGEVVRLVGAGASDLVGRLDLPTLIGVVAGARAVLANDTGPVHLASALGVPVLGLYGPNTPVVYGPLSAGSTAFYRALPCSPCLTPGSYRSSRCRIHTCMQAIPTGEVTAALVRLLRSPRGSQACARPSS
jgi:heptosyltransferase-3